MDRLPVAVVGCGLFGEIHARAYAGFEHADLRIVCDLDESKARHFAERFDCDWTANVDDVAADDRVKAVSVVTPDFTHREPCVKLASAGKHILIEKPLATSSDDAAAIVEAARAAGVTAGVDFHNRYHPAFTEIKRKLDAGEIGEPRMLLVRLSDRLEVATQWFKWAAHSGPQWFLLPHIADMACWLFAAAPERVFATAMRGVLAGRGIDTIDAMHVQLAFPQGVATLETSWILPDAWPCIADFRTSLQTTTSRIDHTGTPQGVVEITPEKHDWPFLLGLTDVGDDQFGYFHLPIRDFVRALLAGRSAPCPLELGVSNVRVIEAALRSVETGQAVEFQS